MGKYLKDNNKENNIIILRKLINTIIDTEKLNKNITDEEKEIINNKNKEMLNQLDGINLENISEVEYIDTLKMIIEKRLENPEKILVKLKVKEEYERIQEGINNLYKQIAIEEIKKIIEKNTLEKIENVPAGDLSRESEIEKYTNKVKEEVEKIGNVSYDKNKTNSKCGDWEQVDIVGKEVPIYDSMEFSINLMGRYHTKKQDITNNTNSIHQLTQNKIEDIYVDRLEIRLKNKKTALVFYANKDIELKFNNSEDIYNILKTLCLAQENGRKYIGKIYKDHSMIEINSQEAISEGNSVRNMIEPVFTTYDDGIENAVCKLDKEIENGTIRKPSIEETFSMPNFLNNLDRKDETRG